MKLEVRYDEKEDKLFFTEISKKSLRIDEFFTSKLYFIEEKQKSGVSKTFAIIDTKFKTFEEFKRWGLENIKERRKLVKVLRELFKLVV